MKKKRPFILLEVLIALTLVALFAVPLMKSPILHYKTQMRQLEEMECLRIADYTFSEIKELLLKNSIPWQELPDKTKRRHIAFPQAQLMIPNLPVRMVSRSIDLACAGEKQGVHNEIFRIYYITIHVGDNTSYHYRTIVQQLDLTKEDKSDS